MIVYTDQLPSHVETKMRKDLAAYETDHGVKVNYKKFSLVLNAEGDNPIGVITAYTAFSEIYVEDMWIDSAWRRNGYGRMLLQELEKHFADKGFNNINLVTSAFSAPEFYQKCGFELEFIRENKVNPKLTKYFFIKYFTNENQTQGII